MLSSEKQEMTTPHKKREETQQVSSLFFLFNLFKKI